MPGMTGGGGSMFGIDRGCRSSSRRWEECPNAAAADGRDARNAAAAAAAVGRNAQNAAAADGRILECSRRWEECRDAAAATGGGTLVLSLGGPLGAPASQAPEPEGPDPFAALGGDIGISAPKRAPPKPAAPSPPAFPGGVGMVGGAGLPGSGGGKPARWAGNAGRWAVEE